MPVLATIATINLLFGSDETDSVSFLNPASLRERCEAVLDDAATRKRALELVEELQYLNIEYNEAVLSTLGTYVEQSADWNTSATDWIDVLENMDASRRRVLREVARVRSDFRELLTTEAWQKVFD